MVEDKTELVRLDRSEGVIDAVVHGRVEEDTWNEDEEVTTGLVYNLQRYYFCALTGEPIGDKESECAKKRGKTKLFSGERLCVRRYDKFFPTKQEKSFKDRRGIGASLATVKGNWQKGVWNQDKRVEEAKEDRREEARAKRMEDGVKDREVVTPPRKEVREVEEEMSKRNSQRAANEVPANDEDGRRGDASNSAASEKAATCVAAALPVTYAPGARQSSS